MKNMIFLRAMRIIFLLSLFSVFYCIYQIYYSDSRVDAILGHAMSVLMRTDLVANYQKFITEILVYSGKGFNLLVNRGWLQQPLWLQMEKG